MRIPNYDEEYSLQELRCEQEREVEYRKQGAHEGHSVYVGKKSKAL
jgi:hypothetical protein